MASFLRLCISYRGLIPHFAETPEQLSKQVVALKVTASEVLEMAFAMLKDELCDGVAVMLPNTYNRLWWGLRRAYMLLQKSYSKAKGKSSRLSSFSVKRSLLLNATTPPTVANFWKS